MRIVFLACLVIFLVSCSSKDLKQQLESHLTKNESLEFYSITKYPKNISQNLLKYRFEELLKRGYFTVENLKNHKDSSKYKITPTSKCKNLILNETKTDYTFIAEEFRFDSIDTIKTVSNDKTFNLVSARFKRTFVTDLFKIDPYTISNEEINSKVIVNLKVKKTFLGLNIETHGISNFIILKK